MEDGKLLTHNYHIIILLSTFINDRPIDFPRNLECGKHIRHLVAARRRRHDGPCLFLCNIRRALPQFDLRPRASHDPVVLPVERTGLRCGALKLVDHVLRREVVFEDRAVHREDHEVVQRLLRKLEEPDAEEVVCEKNFVENANLHQRFWLQRLEKLVLLANLH